MRIENQTPAYGPSVLIVEGDATYRGQLQEMLHELGWAVDTAWNGTIGREKARRHNFDLVLCSLSLPQQDETKTISRIRDLQPHAHIVALAAPTALPADPGIAMACLTGADSVLNK